MNSLILLNPGDQFEIPKLSNLFKNLTVLRQSDCSVLVRGMIREYEKEPWVTKNTLMAASLKVEPTGKTVKIVQTADGRAEIEQKFETRSGPLGTIPTIQNSFSTGKRGRKPKHGPISFPNNPFKIKDLASELGLDYQTVMNSFVKVRDQYKVVGTEKNDGKRGRATSIFQKI